MALCTLGAGTSSLGGGGGGGTSFSCSDLETCLDVTFPGRVRIGTLYVTGTGFIEHPVEWFVGDPLITLNSGVDPSVPNTYDIGWVGDRGLSINVASFWDESSDQFALASTADDGTTKGNIAITSYESLKLQDLYATGSIYTTGRIGIGTETPSYSLEIKRTGVENYVPSSNTRSSPSGIFAYLNHHTPFAGAGEGGLALMAFKDRPTSSVWYLGEAGSQNDGVAAPTFSGPFVIGNRRASTAYSENLRIDMSGNVGIGISNPWDHAGPQYGLAVSGNISGQSGIFEKSVSGQVIRGQSGRITYDIEIGTGDAVPTLWASGDKVGIGTPGGIAGTTAATHLEVSGSVCITGASASLMLPHLSDTERAALEPEKIVGGMMIFNTTVAEFQGYTSATGLGGAVQPGWSGFSMHPV